MISDGGKICLDGRDSEAHPYSCEKMVGEKKMVLNRIRTSLTIQGWHEKTHISCKLPLIFEHSRNRLLRITFSNLVFHKKAFGLNEVSCFIINITNCKVMNCMSAIDIEQEESKVCTNSSIVITETEFLNNTHSVFANLSNEFFHSKSHEMCF